MANLDIFFVRFISFWSTGHQIAQNNFRTLGAMEDLRNDTSKRINHRMAFTPTQSAH